MNSIDTEYFRERAIVERQLAEQAAGKSAAEAHRQMAEAYEALIRRFDPAPAPVADSNPAAASPVVADTMPGASLQA